jgi:hypothetical protein
MLSLEKKVFTEWCIPTVYFVSVTLAEGRVHQPSNPVYIHNFCFFHRCYSPLWALACQTMSLHFVLSVTNSLHLLNPRTWSSLSTSSLHPFHLFSPSFPGPSPSFHPFQFLSEHLFRHPILLHSLQVTQPNYPFPLYSFYYIFSFTHLF